jgi:hypothetical protein
MTHVLFNLDLSIPLIAHILHVRPVYIMFKPLRKPIAGPRRPLAGSSIQPRKPLTGARAGTNARSAEEGYLYVAGVKDASNRVAEFRVGNLSSIVAYEKEGWS